MGEERRVKGGWVRREGRRVGGRGEKITGKLIVNKDHSVAK